MPFGKYKGLSLEEICERDPGYLKWMLREEVGSEALQAEAARLLEAESKSLSRRPPPSIKEAAGGSVNFGPIASGALGLLVVLVIVYRIINPPPPPPTPTPTGAPTIVPTVAGFTPRPPTPTSAPTSNPPDGSECIGAEEAWNYEGEYVCVEHAVVRTYNSGKAVFLNSRDPYQGHFYVCIFPERWNCWPQAPEVYFRGKRIRVYGKIEIYDGSPEIVLRDCSAIQVVN